MRLLREWFHGQKISVQCPDDRHFLGAPIVVFQTDAKLTSEMAKQFREYHDRKVRECRDTGQELENKFVWRGVHFRVVDFFRPGSMAFD